MWGGYHYNKTNNQSITSKPKDTKLRFVVKFEIDKVEAEFDVRMHNKYNVCKSYEIPELWSCKQLTNHEFLEMFLPFKETLWHRGDLSLLWKLVISSMYTPIGRWVRNIYLNK